MKNQASNSPRDRLETVAKWLCNFCLACALGLTAIGFDLALLGDPLMASNFLLLAAALALPSLIWS